MDIARVLGTTGIVLVVMGAAQLLPALSALVIPGQRPGPLFLGAAASIVAGLVLLPLRHGERKLRRREALAIVALSWWAAILSSAVPYWALGMGSWIDGLVESASGLTTTGATVFPEVDSIPPPIHMWRAMTHWLGGAGIVLIVLILTPWLGGGEELRSSQRAETSFFTDSYGGSARTTLKGLFTVYVGATLLLWLLLGLLGLSAWDGLLHSFATISTGGFSTRTASLGAWGNAVQLVVLAFMLLGALNFGVLGRAIDGVGRLWSRTYRESGAGEGLKRCLRFGPGIFFRPLLRHGEVRGYLKMVFWVSALIGVLLFTQGDATRYGELGLRGFGQAWVDASVTVGAISTTTGYCTVNYATWPPGCQAILIVLMLVGGCSGSTSGGIKFRRVQILWKAFIRELRILPRPRAVIPIKLGEELVTEEQIHEAGRFVAVYVLLIMLAWLLISFSGSDPVSAGSAAVSSMGSIGPGFGDCDPSGSFKPYAGAAKLVCVVAMLLGRLEVFPPLSVLLPSFWLRRRR